VGEKMGGGEGVVEEAWSRQEIKVGEHVRTMVEGRTTAAPCACSLG
jgi:hypothetical protein